MSSKLAFGGKNSRIKTILRGDCTSIPRNSRKLILRKNRSLCCLLQVLTASRKIDFSCQNKRITAKKTGRKMRKWCSEHKEVNCRWISSFAVSFGAPVFGGSRNCRNQRAGEYRKHITRDLTKHLLQYHSVRINVLVLKPKSQYLVKLRMWQLFEL